MSQATSRSAKVGLFLFLTFMVTSMASARTVTFNDVYTDTSYQKAILWTVDEGITRGYSNGFWGPDNCVTRAEIVKMFLEFNPDNDTSDVVLKDPHFRDVERDDWYYDYIKEAKSRKFVDGYSDLYFRPNFCVNRAEALKMATNILFDNPDLSGSSGIVYYDDKLVVDIKSYDWYGIYANFLFRQRLVGTEHTQSAGNVNGIPNIKFFPEGDMTRKEVAELLYRVSKLPQFEDL